MTAITRRSALTLTGGGLLVALSGCNSSQPAATSTAAGRATSTATTSGTTTTPPSGSSSASARGSASSSAAVRKPTTQDWVDFAHTVKGPVDLPGSGPYNRTKLIFDTRYDGNKPAAVMVVERTADVARAMRFAAQHGLQIAPRGGGHSYVGASAANGTLVLDMRSLDAVGYRASDRTVAVGTGATLYAVKKYLASRGRGIPTGTCPTVGVAGLTLGGGLGVESRAHGLTADRLTAAQLVLPDGRTVTADAKHNTDIFWALRGGGGGNLGLVTSMRFATHATGDQGIFTLTFPGNSAVRVMTGWANWIRTATRSRWAGVHIDAASGGNLHVSILGVTESGDERAAAASLLTAVGVTPTATKYQRFGYLDAAIYLGGGTTSQRQGFTAGSDVLSSVTAAAASAIEAAVVARSRTGLPGSALLDPLTGAVSDPGSAATAFPWRDHVASIQWYAGGTAYSAAHSWIADAHRRLGSHSAGGYVNYLETGQPAKRYYAGNLSRLARIRHHYDPARRLHSGLAV